VDEETTRPGHWLESQPFFLCGALTISCDGLLAHKNVPLMSKGSLLEHVEEKPGGTGFPRFTWKMAIKAKVNNV